MTPRPGISGRTALRRGAAILAVVLGLALAAGTAPAVHAQGKAKAKSGARGTAAKPAAPGDEVLARVGDATITRAEFEDRLAELPAQFRSQVSTPEQKRTFLDRMIEEKIWYQAALQAGVADRPDVRKRLESDRRDILVRTFLGEEMQKVPAPSDSAVQAYYDAHPDEFMTEEQVRVRHIQVPDEKTAKQVRAELGKPKADFAALAKKYSVDAVTKDKGGDLGLVTRSGFFGSLGRQPAFAESAFASPLNVPRGPLKTGLGWHVYEVTERDSAHVRPLEEVRPLILRQLTQQANQAWYQERLAATRQRLGVQVDSSAIDSLLNARKSAVEMFREAGEQTNPDDRIRAYRQVVELYPQSEYAPQALFMVGFVESEEKRDYDKAEAAFKDLLARYPGSELVASAQWMIDNMRSDATPDFELPGGLGSASEHDSPDNQPATPKH